MEFPCNFTIVGSEYSCHAINLNAITLPGTEIAVEGRHEANKSDEDVTTFVCCKMRLSYLPSGLNVHFPDLTNLNIDHCELKEISRMDLFGLENLEILDLCGNRLSMLPDDLFNDVTKLDWIDLSFNNITRASSKLLLPLCKNDLYVIFKGNPTINEDYDDGSGRIEKLMKDLDEKCKPPFKMHNESHGASGKLLETGKLSDFTLKVGAVDRFMVHKCVLAAQSPVFDAMFESKMQENASGDMMITAFSTAAVADFLHFIYNGVVRSFSNAMELFALAEKYEVPTLKEISENIIEINLNISNALEIFNLGHLYDCDRLKRSALKVIVKFIKVDLDDEFLDHPDTLKELITARKVILNQKRKINDLLALPSKRMRPNPSH